MLISMMGKTPKIKCGERTKNKVDNCFSNIFIQENISRFSLYQFSEGI